MFLQSWPFGPKEIVVSDEPKQAAFPTRAWSQTVTVFCLDGAEKIFPGIFHQKTVLSIGPLCLYSLPVVITKLILHSTPSTHRKIINGVIQISEMAQIRTRAHGEKMPGQGMRVSASGCKQRVKIWPFLETFKVLFSERFVMPKLLRRKSGT